jgi:purine-cytosine permease-like protein
MLGFGCLDTVVGGQVLSAVADGNISVVVGVVITSLVTWGVTVLGLPLFHLYER